MIKKQEMSYLGMSKDLSSDKQSDKYFDARNIRILGTDQKSSFAITNEQGNEQIFSIPTPVFDFANTNISYIVGSETKTLSYSTITSVVPRCELEEVYIETVAAENSIAYTSGTQTIIGATDLRDSALIITTDGVRFDCFWEVTNLNNGAFELNLLYMNNLALSSDNLIQILYNYENSIIQKIYFVDGFNQLRFFNIRQSVANGDSLDLVDVPRTAIDVVSDFQLSQPVVSSVLSGGSHTTGMIQFAYGLYILNGSQTTISPLSELTPIDKGVGQGGGEVNEVLGRSVSITISDIDQHFTHIKLYSIKYTSLNENPEITIIADREIDNFTTFSYTDDGAGGTAISLEAFTFLGSDPLIPKHIVTKDNRLFPINITELTFDLDIDCRAYSFDSGSNAVVLDGAYINNYDTVIGTSTSVTSPDFALLSNHDAVNKDYNTYKFQLDGVTPGATGKYVEVELFQNTLTDSDAKDLQFFKDRELYRIGIKFYNRRGQTSDPKWIMDLLAPTGNLEGNYNQLKVTLTTAFYTWLADLNNFPEEDDIPVGYKIIRADRTLNDQTIITQGVINPMIANYVTQDKKTEVSLSKRKANVNGGESNKMPSLVRVFETISPLIKAKDYHCLSWASENDSTFAQLGRGTNREAYKTSDSDDFRALNYQHNRLMQMFSPEVMFRSIQIDASYKLRIVGLVTSSANHNWGTEINPISEVQENNIKFSNGFTVSSPGVSSQVITGDAIDINDMAVFGGANAKNLKTTNQFYREFLGAFVPATGTGNEYNIYGSPEITQQGADYTSYNNDANLRYCNHLKTMMVDNMSEDSQHVHDDAGVQVQGCNTIGAKCVTFAEGSDLNTAPLDSRKTITQMHTASGVAETNGMLVAEFAKDSNQLYVSNIYGGMSNESKRNASYIEIGSYENINTNTTHIQSPGDTFVNTFTFTKLVKDDLNVVSREFNILSEIVSARVETTVDLKNRNDLSLSSWDNRWQPKYDEYQKYNTVYSQQSKLNSATDVGTKLKKIQEFDGRIMASKEKIPGEFVDSWTDFLVNESQDLDGKYGPINGVVNMKDEIFVLQDSAVAHISINPRVQTTGSDGIALELGTGGIVHDYTYLSTTSGTLNKWGVITTDESFYFIDLIKKSIMSCNGQQVVSLTDMEGFHSEMINSLNYDDLVLDNPVLGTGVSVGFNSVNQDVYFSFLQSANSFTLGFNKKTGSFVSYYDYIPAWYINKGERMITVDPTNTQLWEHFRGLPNHFYGQHFKSQVTLHIAPQGNEIILNGASYKLELTDRAGNEVPLEGLTGIRAYNDYQDSGVKPLVMRSNVFKKFRNWSVKFPRTSGSRDRVRSAWGFAEFSFDNTLGRRLILHDITIFYTQH